MVMDSDTLFVAAGICAGAMAVALVSVWHANRADRFVGTWVFALIALAIGVSLYSVSQWERSGLMALAFTLKTFGFFALLMAARQIAGLREHRLAMLAVATLVAVASALPVALEWGGLGLMVFNLAMGGVMVATARCYWHARAQAPGLITGLALMYAIVACSFMACGMVLVASGALALPAKPDNWAEQINAIVCISGVVVIGALSLSLNQARISQRHKQAALTDTLTGLANRRAAFEDRTGRALDGSEALIAFDLDRFKTINDRYGHAAGDAVLVRFAQTLGANLRPGDFAARIGGEEFIVLLRDADLPLASTIAERIRSSFSRYPVETAEGPVQASTSSGIAFVRPGERDIAPALKRADQALYSAKNAGRNRVVTELIAVA